MGLTTTVGCDLFLILCLFWSNGLEAAFTETNIDTLEPSVIQSPALSTDPDDGFGWAAVFHQVETVLNSDSMEESLRKTKYIASSAM